MVVDDMKNSFAETFGAWPERFAIVQRGTIAKLGHPTSEFGYDREEIETWLRSLTNPGPGNAAMAAAVAAFPPAPASGAGGGAGTTAAPKVGAGPKVAKPSTAASGPAWRLPAYTTETTSDGAAQADDGTSDKKSSAAS